MSFRGIGFTRSFTAAWLMILACVVMGGCAAIGTPSVEKDSDLTNVHEPVIDTNFSAGPSVSIHPPTVVTRDMVQDAKGDIWFATFYGVVRYDGEFYTNLTNQVPLQPTRAFSLLRDRHDNIWVGTAGAGVYKFDGVTYTRITARDGLSNNRVLSMFEDRDGNLWFGHEGAGVTRYANKRFTTFGAQQGFTDDDVSSMVQDSSGRIWFGTRDGLFYFDGENFERFSQAEHLPTGGFIPTFIDANDQLWFGGKNGLYHFDGTRLRQVTKDGVSALESGIDGSIWFGGGSTLHQIPANAFLGEPRSISANVAGSLIFDLFRDREGRLWIGSFGVTYLDTNKTVDPANGRDWLSFP